MKHPHRHPPLVPPINTAPNLRYKSIHDVLTDRAPDSDPTDSSARGPQPPPIPLQTIKKKTPRRHPPLVPPINTAPNLRYKSIHDVLTHRQKDSDPTDRDKT